LIRRPAPSCDDPPGEDESGQYSFIDVFVKQKGEWKAVSGQVTPVAKDEATE